MCVAAIAIAQPYAAPAPSHQVREAYYQGQLVSFEAERDSLITRSFVVGQWRFGRRFSAKPHDGRLNLYVTSPGSQYSVDGGAPYTFNCIVNALPNVGAEVEWDVYWAVVLDPSFANEIRTEQDLLLGTQAEFAPAQDFAIQKIPGRELLRRYLHVTTVNELDQYRRKSGELPRVLIVPAHVVLKASAGSQQQASE